MSKFAIEYGKPDISKYSNDNKALAEYAYAIAAQGTQESKLQKQIPKLLAIGGQVAESMLNKILDKFQKDAEEALDLEKGAVAITSGVGASSVPSASPVAGIKSDLEARAKKDLQDKAADIARQIGGGGRPPHDPFGEWFFGSDGKSGGWPWLIVAGVVLVALASNK